MIPAVEAGSGLIGWCFADRFVSPIDLFRQGPDGPNLPRLAAAASRAGNARRLYLQASLADRVGECLHPTVILVMPAIQFDTLDPGRCRSFGDRLYQVSLPRRSCHHC